MSFLAISNRSLHVCSSLTAMPQTRDAKQETNAVYHGELILPLSLIGALDEQTLISLVLFIHSIVHTCIHISMSLYRFFSFPLDKRRFGRIGAYCNECTFLSSSSVI